jgi:hypothetical protein
MWYLSWDGSCLTWWAILPILVWCPAYPSLVSCRSWCGTVFVYPGLVSAYPGVVSAYPGVVSCIPWCGILHILPILIWYLAYSVVLSCLSWCGILPVLVWYYLSCLSQCMSVAGVVSCRSPGKLPVQLRLFEIVPYWVQVHNKLIYSGCFERFYIDTVVTLCFKGIVSRE